MNKPILAGAAFLAAAAVAVPMIAWSADAPPTGPAPTASGQPGGGQPGMGEHHHGWGHRMAMRSPQQRCESGIARRAARAAYVESLLNLTPDQRPLAAKVEAALQGAADKEHQLCSSLPTDAKAAPATLIDRLNRREQMMQARLDGMKQVQPALQALYAALTPQQKQILDHPFHRG
jgi:hypothetical protein